MNSLSDMAARYDEWAKAHEATAKDILACLDSFAEGIRENQRWRADWLTAEAAELRARAAQLREVNRQVRCTNGPTSVSDVNKKVYVSARSTCYARHTTRHHE
jgi:hypothetical protein